MSADRRPLRLWAYEGEHATSDAYGYPLGVGRGDKGREPTLAEIRRFLALTETGPDYEAAHVAYEDQYDDMDENGINIHAIVDAALADYLTEEE